MSIVLQKTSYFVAFASLQNHTVENYILESPGRPCAT
ncbi:hypothetical protein PI125_g3165 [Phytophthora idaei]|nr:hypothetical protein PI125_g3165 [Phytophthora idaei]